MIGEFWQKKYKMVANWFQNLVTQKYIWRIWPNWFLLNEVLRRKHLTSASGYGLGGATDPFENRNIL